MWQRCLLIVTCALAPAAIAQDVRWERMPPPHVWQNYRAYGADVGSDGSVLFAALGFGSPSDAILRFVPNADTAQIIGVPRYSDDVVVSNEDDLILRDGSRLQRSVDAGATWAIVHDRGGKLSRLTEGPYSGTIFIGRVGYGGFTARSDDAGATWHDVEVPAGSLDCDTFLALPRSDHPERVLGGCVWGVALSDDGGLTFVPSQLWQPGYTVAYSFARLPDGTAFAMVGGACCHGGVYRSLNGEDWELVFDGGGKAHIVSVGPTLYFVRWDGAVWRTLDRGQTWHKLVPVYEGVEYIRVVDVVADSEGRLWAAVTGPGVQAPRFGVYRTAGSALSEEIGPEARGVRLDIWPNPARSGATVSLYVDAPVAIRLAVFDILGRGVGRLHEGPVASGAHQFAVSPALPAGRYVARLISEGLVASRSFTVVR